MTRLALTFLVILLTSCNSSTQPQFTTAEGHYFPIPVNASEAIQSEDQTFKVDTVVEGLRSPWGMAFLPDGTVLITERTGNLRIIRNGKLETEPVQGVPEVYVRGQGGLLDVEIHPEYEKNGWIYLAYSIPGEGGGHTGVSRFKLQGNALVNQELLFSGEPKTNRAHHFGTRIVFDREGYMYFAIGDRGEMQNAQNLGNHSGKVLRLYDDGRIPADNPFVNEPGARPELFTYGNRNIQGMTRHPETGEIWSHEHGPRGGDEINIIRKGTNYGWPSITYGINYDGSIITTDTAKAGMAQPLHYWTPSIAPAGMDFVTGDRYPGWKGDLMSGSLSFRFLQRTVLDGETVKKEERLLQDIGRVRDVRMAPDGFLYVLVEGGGRLIRLLPEDS